jgi:phospholipid transport system transporter-binding protein
VSTLQIGGRLTFDTAAARLGELAWPAEGEALLLDLAALDAVDSAGVSVLLHWQRAARERGVLLRWQGAPTGLRQLLEVYGLTELFAAA